MSNDIYYENFYLIFDMPSVVVNQGPETLLGDGKNHVYDRGVLHGYK